MLDDTIDALVSAHAAPDNGPAPEPANTSEPVAPPAPVQNDSAPAPAAFDWPTFPEEQAPPDRFAPYQTDDLLQGFRLPPEAQQAWLADRELIRSFKTESETAAQLREAFAPLGGEAAAPLAVDLTARLFGAAEIDPLDARRLQEQYQEIPDAPIAQLAFLDTLKQTNKGLYRDLRDAALLHDFEGTYKSLESEFFRRTGLNPALLDSYQAVTAAGGYRPPADLAEVTDFKSRVPQALHATFDRLPRDVQQDLIDGRPEAAKFHLETYARNFAHEDREQQEKQQREQQEKQQAEATYQAELGKVTQSYYDSYIQKGTALGFDRARAAGIAWEAHQKLQQMAAGDTRMQQLDREYERAIRTNNQPLRDRVAREYDQIVNRVWRQTINELNPSRSRLSGSAQPPQAPVTAGAPTATLAQFEPASARPVYRSAEEEISSIVARYARS